MYKSMNSFRYYVIVIIALFSCCSNEDTLDPAIALKIGDMAFPMHEYTQFIEKQKELYTSKYKNTPSVAIISSFQKEYIEQCLLYTEAVRRGFDQHPEILKTIDSFTRTILFQENGLYFQKIIADSVILTESIIDTAISRIPKTFVLKHITFATKEDALSIQNKLPVNTLSEFEHLQSLFFKNPDVKTGELTWYWLSPKLVGLRNFIFNMKENDCSPLLFNIYDYSILFVKDIYSEPIEEVENTLLKQRLNPRIKRIEAQKRAYDHDNSIFLQANISFNDNFLDSLWHDIKVDSISSFDKEHFKKSLNTTLLTYTTNYELNNVSFEDLINYYNTLTARKPIIDKFLLYRYLRDCVWEKFAMNIVLNNNLLEASDVKPQRTIWNNNLIVNRMVRSLVKDFSDYELKKYYDNNILKYNLGEYTDISIFEFTARKHAFRARTKILKSDIITRLSMNNFLDELKEITSYDNFILSYKDSSMFSSDIIERIFLMPVKNLSNPIEYNDKYILVYKNNITGDRIMPFNEAKKIVQNELFQYKLNTVRRQMISQLREKMEIIINFDNILH